VASSMPAIRGIQQREKNNRRGRSSSIRRMVVCTFPSGGDTSLHHFGKARSQKSVWQEPATALYSVGNRVSQLYHDPIGLIPQSAIVCRKVVPGRQPANGCGGLL